MKLGACLMLTLPVLGCVNVANQSAICDGTQDARAAHAEALASEASDAAVITGARLIALLDAGCGDAG
jgi:pyrimidine deaminase RibD-like protein